MNKNTKAARKQGYADADRKQRIFAGAKIDTSRPYEKRKTYPGGGPSLHDQAVQLGRAKAYRPPR